MTERKLPDDWAIEDVVLHELDRLPAAQWEWLYSQSSARIISRAARQRVLFHAVVVCHRRGAVLPCELVKALEGELAPKPARNRPRTNDEAKVRAVDYEACHPEASYGAIAKHAGLPRSTVQTLRKHPDHVRRVQEARAKLLILDPARKVTDEF